MYAYFDLLTLDILIPKSIRCLHKVIGKHKFHVYNRGTKEKFPLIVHPLNYGKREREGGGGGREDCLLHAHAVLKQKQIYFKL